MNTPVNTLKDRVALITGASRGIGRAIAIKLASQGVHLVLAAKTMEKHEKLPGTLPQVAQACRQQGVEVLVVQTDVRQTQAIENLFQQTEATFGRLDILINNAGAAWWYGLEETPLKKFDLVMDINTRAPFLACQLALPLMRRHRWGQIVNMSPPLKPQAAQNKIAYWISKQGMTLLTIGLAAELAAKKEPIAVHSLWPVTMIESAATQFLGLGRPSDWRKPDILADATLALLEHFDPSAPSGRAWLDEAVLTTFLGQTDFSGYSVVPGSQPKMIPW